MIIKKGSYTFDEFRDLLNEYVYKTRTQIHIVALITRLGTLEENLDAFKKAKFQVARDFGAIKELTTSYYLYKKKIIVRYYLYHDIEHEILLLFTENGSRDINRTLYFINNTKNLHYLWIPPRPFEQLKGEILENTYANIIYFAGERDVGLHRTTCERRPSVSRKITYSGVDAKTSLEELKIEYGVLPKVIEFYIPEIGVFRINNRGIFVLKEGNLDFLLDRVVNRAIDLALETTRILEKSRFELVRHKEINAIEMQQVIISLSEEIEYEDFEGLIELMKGNDFAVYNETLEKGSVFFTGYITDQLKGNVLSVTSNGKTFSVIPKYNSTFDSLIRFYQFLVENIDVKAECELA